MNKFITAALLSVAASPAFAASGPFISLKNTDFVVLVAFLIFVGILIHYKVPSKIGEMLDGRSVAIKADLNEAKALREQASRIVASAKEEAANAAVAAKADIAASITRRLAAAVEQIASAEASAVKAVKDQAVVVAIGAARDVIAAQMDAKSSNALIAEAIDAVEAKLH